MKMKEFFLCRSGHDKHKYTLPSSFLRYGSLIFLGWKHIWNSFSTQSIFRDDFPLCNNIAEFMPHKKILWNLGTFFFLFMQLALIVIVLPVTNISNLPKSKKSRAGPGEEYRYKFRSVSERMRTYPSPFSTTVNWFVVVPSLPPPPLAVLSKWQGKFLDWKRFSH